MADIKDICHNSTTLASLKARVGYCYGMRLKMWAPLNVPYVEPGDRTLLRIAISSSVYYSTYGHVLGIHMLRK